MDSKFGVPLDVLIGAYDAARVKAELAKIRSVESKGFHDAYIEKQKELFKAALDLGDAMVKMKKEGVKFDDKI